MFWVTIKYIIYIIRRCVVGVVGPSRCLGLAPPGLLLGWWVWPILGYCSPEAALPLEVMGFTTQGCSGGRRRSPRSVDFHHRETTRRVCRREQRGSPAGAWEDELESVRRPHRMAGWGMAVGLRHRIYTGERQAGYPMGVHFWDGRPGSLKRGLSPTF